MWMAYTGLEGRHLSDNKRTAERSCDQTLTRMNRALALNRNVPVNDKMVKAKLQIDLQDSRFWTDSNTGIKYINNDKGSLKHSLTKPA